MASSADSFFLRSLRARGIVRGGQGFESVRGFTRGRIGRSRLPQAGDRRHKLTCAEVPSAKLTETGRPSGLGDASQVDARDAADRYENREHLATGTAARDAARPAH